MAGGNEAAARVPAYSNIVKQFANWNVCFLCGFGIEDGDLPYALEEDRPPGGIYVQKRTVVDQHRI